MQQLCAIVIVAIGSIALVVLAWARHDVEGKERGWHVAATLLFFGLSSVGLAMLLVLHLGELPFAAEVGAGLALALILVCVGAGP